MRFIASSYIILALDGFGFIHGKGLAVIGGKGNREVCPDCPDNYNAEELTWALVTLAIVTGLFFSICFCRFYPKLRALFISPSDGGLSAIKPCQCNTIIHRGSTTATMGSPSVLSTIKSQKLLHQKQTREQSSIVSPSLSKNMTMNCSTPTRGGKDGVTMIGLSTSKSIVNDNNTKDNNMKIPIIGGGLSISASSAYQPPCQPNVYSTASTVDHHHSFYHVNQQQQRLSSSSMLPGTTITSSTSIPSHSSIASSSSSSSGHHLIHHKQSKQYPTYSYPNRSSIKSRSSSSSVAPITSVVPSTSLTVTTPSSSTNSTTIIDPNIKPSSLCHQLILSCPQQQSQMSIVPINSGQSSQYTSHI